MKASVDPFTMEGWEYLWMIGLSNLNPNVREKANCLASRICLVFFILLELSTPSIIDLD